MTELCTTWLRRHPDGTTSDVDSKPRADFHLVEIDPDVCQMNKREANQPRQRSSSWGVVEGTGPEWLRGSP